jgi:hypothetical protein
MLENEVRDRGVPGRRDLENLVRSLVGVADVAIAELDGALSRIAVTPDGTTSDRQLMRNVFSALKAHFGLDIDPAAITISPVRADTSSQNGTAAPARGSAQANPVSARRNGAPADPRVANANGAGSNSANGTPASANGVAKSPATNGLAANGNSLKRNATGEAGPYANGHASTHVNAVAHTRVITDLATRLDSVEFQRNGSIRRCRVVITSANDRFTGIADALDAHVSDMELVGYASVDALRASSDIHEALRFEGVTVTDVAGRAHVIVSVARVRGPEFELYAGAEPIRATAAEATARAIIGSLNAWPVH